MNVYLNSYAQFDKLQQHFAAYHRQIPVVNSTKVEHNKKIYTHVATYTFEDTTLSVLEKALATFFSFGLSCCCTANLNNPERKIYSLYLEEPTTKKVSLSTEKLIQKTLKPTLISTQLIGNQAPNNAFTDLIFFNNQFFCCFRESIFPQVGDNGTIRILSSPDAKTWSSVALLSLDYYDLRDPKLSQTPDGKLLLNMGATKWGSNGSENPNSAVSFSSDGVNWEPVQILPYPGLWNWRVTWYNNLAYGTFYYTEGTETKLKIMTSPDGKTYTDLVKLKIPNSPTEATLRFLADGTMVALVRCDNGNGVIGTSSAPYQEWTWNSTNSVLGGPDFLVLPDGSMWASSRQINGSTEATILALMTTDSYQPLLTLPSGDDTGYTGMVIQKKKTATGGYTLYLSFYLNSYVYLAIIDLS